jgi:hypothetical protein
LSEIKKGGFFLGVIKPHMQIKAKSTVPVGCNTSAGRCGEEINQLSNLHKCKKTKGGAESCMKMHG